MSFVEVASGRPIVTLYPSASVCLETLFRLIERTWQRRNATPRPVSIYLCNLLPPQSYPDTICKQLVWRSRSRTVKLKLLPYSWREYLGMNKHETVQYNGSLPPRSLTKLLVTVHHRQENFWVYTGGGGDSCGGIDVSPATISLLSSTHPLSSLPDHKQNNTEQIWNEGVDSKLLTQVTFNLNTSCFCGCNEEVEGMKITERWEMGRCLKVCTKIWLL
jgi:hypothetical protein